MEIYQVNYNDNYEDIFLNNIFDDINLLSTLNNDNHMDTNSILPINISSENSENNEKKTYIEKFIYEKSIYHLNNRNLSAKYIEFWYKSTINMNSVNNWHFDKDEKHYDKYSKFILPKLTIVTYFEDSDVPILIPRISPDDYLYKNFEDKHEVFIYFPKKNTQLIFNGGNEIHGVVDILNSIEKEQNKGRKILIVNLWDEIPDGLNIVDLNKKIPNNKLINNNNSYIQFKNITDEIKRIIDVNSKMFSFEFFNDLLYNKKIKLEDSILMDIKKSYKDDNKNLIILKDKDYKSEEIINKINFFKDYDEINITNKINYKNRFLQRFIIDNIFDKFTCEFIINQAEIYSKNNNGWTTKRHDNYPTTDLPVSNIKNIYVLILEKFKSVFDKIGQYYVFPKDVTFNVQDLFIVKYSENIQKKLEMHKDGSFITINILLNDNFEGGGSIFYDGITEHNSIGSGLVHCGLLEHGGKEITKGVRYILVCFSNIIKN